jgi:hypothetical protein
MSGWLLAYIASSAFTGIVSAHQANQGCREMNPFAPSRPAYNLAFKAGTATGLGFALHFTIKHNEKTGKALAGFAIGTNVAVGIHDAMQRCK